MRAIVVSALLLALAGCSKPKLPPTVEVTFNVTFADGKPVADMLLTLHPQTSDIEQPAPKLIDKSGTCVMTCQPGTYRVTLAPIPSGHGNADPASPLNTPPTGQARTAAPPALPLSPAEVTITESTREQKLEVRANAPAK